MLTITKHSVEKLEDPFGILPGERYEFHIHIDVPEDYELFTDKGLYVKVLFIIDEKGERILQYHVIEKITNQYLDFNLDEEEEKMIEEYCKDNLPI